MTKNQNPHQPLLKSRIDQLVHAIALAMARRQMLSVWPRR